MSCAGAAVTELHALGAQTTEISVLAALEAGRQCPQRWFLLRPPPRLLGTPFSLCHHSVFPPHMSDDLILT